MNADDTHQGGGHSVLSPVFGLGVDLSVWAIHYFDRVLLNINLYSFNLKSSLLTVNFELQIVVKMKIFSGHFGAEEETRLECC